MERHNWVLAVTKRAASMCATQSRMCAAGLELITATNLAAARAAIRSLHIDAVIVCHHSWTREERHKLAAELAVLRPEIKFILRCPGCVDRDDAAGTPGRLTETLPLTQLIAAISPARTK